MSIRLGYGMPRGLWLVLCLAMVGLAVLTGKYLWLSIACRHWPSAPGIILLAREHQDTVQRPPRQSGRPVEFVYRAEIEYAYTVGGIAYTGTQVAFSDYAGFSGSRKAVKERLVRYVPGSAVTVYYDSANPRMSVLERRSSRDILFWPAIFTALALVCAIGFCKDWRLSTRRGWAGQG